MEQATEILLCFFFFHSQLQRPESTEQKSAMEEYYLSCLGCSGPLALSTSTSPAVTVEPTNLVFNIRMSSPVCATWSSSQTVSVTNHTKLELWYTACHAQWFTVYAHRYNLFRLLTVTRDALSAWCGLLHQILHFPYFLHHANWCHWSALHL